MYICSTKRNDVRKSIEEMKGRMSSEDIADLIARNDGQGLPTVLQVSMTEYRRLKKEVSRNALIEIVRQKEIKHAINFNTLTLHTKECRHMDEKPLTASILNSQLTGLRLCKHCKP